MCLHLIKLIFYLSRLCHTCLLLLLLAGLKGNILSVIYTIWSTNFLVSSHKLIKFFALL
jgi:hypothetical protein